MSIIRVVVILICIFPLNGSCNQIKELTLQERISASDNIMVVEILNSDIFESGDYERSLEFKTLYILKGKNVKKGKVYYSDYISEIYPGEFLKGGEYLIFIECINGRYFFVNSPYGAYLLDK